jgi:cation-transporting P-type ATPase E
MLSVLAVAVLATGRYGDALFAIVLVLNALIGIGRRCEPSAPSIASPCCTRQRPAWCATERQEVRPRRRRARRPGRGAAGDQVPADGQLVDVRGAGGQRVGAHRRIRRRAKDAGDRCCRAPSSVAGRGAFVADRGWRRRLRPAVGRRGEGLHPGRQRDRPVGRHLLRYITWIIAAVTPLLLWSQWRTSMRPTTGANRSPARWRPSSA